LSWVWLAFGSIAAFCVGPEPGSRWSARSEARTYDLDAGEDRRIWWCSTQGPPVSGHGDRRVGCEGRDRSRCAASPCLIWVLGPMAARRRDGVWGEPGDGLRLLILSGTTAASGDDRRIAGASRGHQLNGTRARTGHRSQAALPFGTGLSSISAQAWSPSSRRMWWQRRTSLRATDRAGRLPPSRSLTAT